MFLMLDPQDEQFDRRLAFHLVSLYHITEAEKEGVHMVSCCYHGNHLHIDISVAHRI